MNRKRKYLIAKEFVEVGFIGLMKSTASLRMELDILEMTTSELQSLLVPRIVRKFIRGLELRYSPTNHSLRLRRQWRSDGQPTRRPPTWELLRSMEETWANSRKHYHTGTAILCVSLPIGCETESILIQITSTLICMIYWSHHAVRARGPHKKTKSCSIGSNRTQTSVGIVSHLQKPWEKRDLSNRSRAT